MQTGHRRFSARGMTAFAGGALAGVIASRLLPPFLAQAGGAALGRDPFEVLTEDHRHFVELLTRMEDDAAGPVNRMQLLLRLKRRLTAHALAEEDVIYPMLHDRESAATGDGARHLYGEHAEIKMHLHALEEMAKDDPGWGARAGELRRLVETHARQEEETEFPKLRQSLDDQAIARLSRAVQREKAMVL